MPSEAIIPLLSRSTVLAGDDRFRPAAAAIPGLKHTAPDGVVAVEVRDPQWLIPPFVEALRDAGATYSCQDAAHNRAVAHPARVMAGAIGVPLEFKPLARRLWLRRRGRFIFTFQ